MGVCCIQRDSGVQSLCVWIAAPFSPSIHVYDFQYRLLLFSSHACIVSEGSSDPIVDPI